MHEITGVYHGMNYKITYVESELLGVYYDVLLTIGNKTSRGRDFTIVGAVNNLVQIINAWDLEQKDILMNPEQAEKRITEWKAAWALLHSLPDDERDSERAKAAMFTILQASIDLGNAGYRTNEDDTDWYHPSEEN
jgi:hypothetical protein